MEYLGALIAALSGGVSLVAFLRAAVTGIYELRARRARKRADFLAATASVADASVRTPRLPAPEGGSEDSPPAQEARREEREARHEEALEEQKLRASEQRWGWSKVEDWGRGHPVALSLVIGVFFLAVTILIASDSSSSARGPHLRVIDRELGDGSGRGEDYAANVLVKLHNDGDQRAILLRLKATVLRTAILDVCVSQGGSGMPETGRYDILFPPDVKPGQQISLMLNQELGPDGADLFRLVFKSPELEGLPALYEVKVVARYDRGPLLSLGRFLVMTPITLSSRGWPFWLARKPSAVRQAAFNEGYQTVPCFRKNRQAVASFADSSAEMTESMRRMVRFASQAFDPTRGT